MLLPPFSEFLSSIDPDKLSYDLTSFSSPNMKENYNPFTQEQYKLIVKTNFAIIEAILTQYHQWLAEQLEA